MQRIQCTVGISISLQSLTILFNCWYRKGRHNKICAICSAINRLLTRSLEALSYLEDTVYNDGVNAFVSLQLQFCQLRISERHGGEHLLGHSQGRY